jgi:hypothetical protein
MQPTNVLLISGFFGSDKENLNTFSNTVFTIKITYSYNNAPKMLTTRTMFFSYSIIRTIALVIAEHKM